MAFRGIASLHTGHNAQSTGLRFEPRHEIMFLPSLGKRSADRDYEFLRNHMHRFVAVQKTGRTWMVKTADGQIFQTAQDPTQFYSGV